MSEDTGNHYHSFEITQKGLELRQRAVAGGLKAEFTRGAIGEGKPADYKDIYFMTHLVRRTLDVPIKENYAENINHVMAIVIDNKDLQKDLLMTEIGIFARLNL